MVNLNDNQTYKAILETLLRALAKHPDFAEIEGMVKGNMPANAANRVKEILTEQATLRESMNPGNFDPMLGMWLKEEKSTDDDPFIIPGETKKESARNNNDDIFILIPSDPGNKSETDDEDDDFGVISY